MTLINKSATVQVTLDEILKDLQAYLKKVELGETLIILKAGKPLAEVKPLTGEEKSRRPFGLGAGDFTVPDDFDAPLPESVLQEFEGQG
jgi:antitoxin (DNA-binding transcriptional repressor) of toxin-antitoxin stability system